MKTKSYNDGTSSYNAAATESWWTTFRIQHRMNSPAECWVTLADPTGSLFQKYNVDANDVYVGPGRLKIRDDGDTTTYFDGRIVKATHYREGGGQLVLYCKDWMSQLDEEHITYDFREQLGSGERTGRVQPVRDGNASNSARPCWKSGSYYWVASHDDDHSTDEWNTDPTGYNGYLLVWLAAMSGTVTSTVGPYSETVTVAGSIDQDTFDNPYNDIENLWRDDGRAHLTVDNDEDWTVEYSFYSWINASGTDHHSSTVSMTVKSRLYFTDVGSECTVSIYNNDTAAYVPIGRIDGEDNSVRHNFEWTVPGDIMDHCVSSSGIVKVKFSVEYNVVATDLNIEWLVVETVCETTQDSTGYQISDTSTTYGLRIDTDHTLSGQGCWTDQPYAIVKKIYTHIDTAEGGTLVSSYDPLVTLTAAGTIEHTSGLTTRRFEEVTAFDILRDVARTDKAVFWVELGTTTLTWKSTFNSGSPTALTDSDVLYWSGGNFDYEKIVNEYHLYGPRQNDSQVIYSTEDASGGDPGSDSKGTFGATRSAVIKDPGTVSEYEMQALGDALVERDEDCLLMLRASIAGFDTTYKLGTEVSVTSTPLSLSTVKYIVSSWDYDHDQDVTNIMLHPRSASTKGLIDVRYFSEEARHVADEVQRLKADQPVLEVIE